MRELATQLGVNRNTVASAYKRLVTSGLALSLGRNGTVVKETAAPVALEGGNPHTPLTDLSAVIPQRNDCQTWRSTSHASAARRVCTAIRRYHQRWPIGRRSGCRMLCPYLEKSTLPAGR